MPSTNKTPKGYSQFLPNDIPKWLQDYNDDMLRIDKSSAIELKHTYFSGTGNLLLANTSLFASLTGFFYFVPTFDFVPNSTYFLIDGTEEPSTEPVICEPVLPNGQAIPNDLYLAGGIAYGYLADVDGAKLLFFLMPTSGGGAGGVSLYQGAFTFSSSSGTVGSKGNIYVEGADFTPITSKANILVKNNSLQTGSWNGNNRTITVISNATGQMKTFSEDKIVDANGSRVIYIPGDTDFIAQISRDSKLRIINPFGSNNVQEINSGQQSWTFSSNPLPVPYNSSYGSCAVTRYKDYNITMSRDVNTDFVNATLGGLLDVSARNDMQWIRVVPGTVRIDKNYINEDFFGIPSSYYKGTYADFAMPATAIHVYASSDGSQPPNLYMKFLLNQCPFIFGDAFSATSINIQFRVEIGSNS